MNTAENRPYLRIHHLTYLKSYLGNLHAAKIDPATIHLDRKTALIYAHRSAVERVRFMVESFQMPVTDDWFLENVIIKRPYTLDLLGVECKSRDQYLAELRRIIFLWLIIDPAEEVSLGFAPDDICFACQSTPPGETGKHCNEVIEEAGYERGDNKVLSILKSLVPFYSQIKIDENNEAMPVTLPGTLLKDLDFLITVSNSYHGLNRD